MLYFFLLYVKKKYILDRYEKEKKVIAYYVNNNERIMGQSNKALHRNMNSAISGGMRSNRP